MLNILGPVESGHRKIILMSGEFSQNMSLPINGFRAKFWYANLVDRISDDGLVEEVEKGSLDKTPALVHPSAKWFARRFPRPNTTPESDRKNWSRYRSGEAVPRMRNGFHPVKIVEDEYPRSANFFFSPIWDVFIGKKIDIEKIESSISSIGSRPAGEIHGVVGKILLDRQYWKQGVHIDKIQEARYSILKDLETFELIEAIVLMLAWSNEEGDPNLWNEICDFYYYIIPEIVWADDIRLRFELLDIIDGYAQKRKKIPFRKAIRAKHSWRDRSDKLHARLTERYTHLISSHMFFWPGRNMDDAKQWWAGIIANVIMTDQILWEKYSDYPWVAVDVFISMLSEGRIEMRSRKNISFFRLARKNTEERNRMVFKFPNDTNDIEQVLKEKFKQYRDNPNGYKYKYEQVC